jgi:hypothetical protein
MTQGKLNIYIKKIETIIEHIDKIRKEINEDGGFETGEMADEFDEVAESAVIYLEECVEYLEANKAYHDYISEP